MTCLGLRCRVPAGTMRRGKPPGAKKKAPRRQPKKTCQKPGCGHAMAPRQKTCPKCGTAQEKRGVRAPQANATFFEGKRNWKKVEGKIPADVQHVMNEDQRTQASCPSHHLRLATVPPTHRKTCPRLPSRRREWSFD